MNNDELQQLTEMIAMNFFGKHFKHQIYFNSRLRSTGGRYLLETHNLEINPKQLLILLNMNYVIIFFILKVKAINIEIKILKY